MTPSSFGLTLSSAPQNPRALRLIALNRDAPQVVNVVMYKSSRRQDIPATGTSRRMTNAAARQILDLGEVRVRRCVKRNPENLAMDVLRIRSCFDAWTISQSSRSVVNPPPCCPAPLPSSAADPPPVPARSQSVSTLERIWRRRSGLPPPPPPPLLLQAIQPQRQ